MYENYVEETSHWKDITIVLMRSKRGTIEETVSSVSHIPKN